MHILRALSLAITNYCIYLAKIYLLAAACLVSLFAFNSVSLTKQDFDLLATEICQEISFAKLMDFLSQYGIQRGLFS